jgi:hypothetical protein
MNAELLVVVAVEVLAGSTAVDAFAILPEGLGLKDDLNRTIRHLTPSSR